MILSFSPSSLAQFRDCPRKFKLQKDKVIVWKDTPQKARGTLAHSFMESRLNPSKPSILPPKGLNIGYTEDLINSLKSLQSKGLELYTEQELVINTEWKPASWWDQNVLIRARADVLLIDRAKNAVIIGDFKTGKIYPGMDYQLRVYALLCYTLYGLHHITWQLYYLDQGETKEGYFDLSLDFNNFVGDIMADMNKIHNLEESRGLYPARQNKFCRFCQVYHSDLYCAESKQW